MRAPYDGPLQHDVQCPYFWKESEQNCNVICEGPMPGVRNELQFERNDVRLKWCEFYCKSISNYENCPVAIMAGYKYAGK